MGETDGQPKDADWAAPITGVPADTIRALARRMAATRTMVTASWSLQRAHHGEQPYWAVMLLASALGQIGLPGGGFGFGYGSGAGIAERRCRSRAPAMDEHQAIRSTSRFRRRASPTACSIPASATTSTASAAPIPTSSWSIGPAAIHSTIIRTPTSCAAPGSGRKPSSCTSRGGPRPRATPTSCCRRPRRWSATTSAARARDRFIIAMQQAIEPVGEARNDFAIFSDLAHRLGCAERLHARPRRDGLAAPPLRWLPPTAPAPTPRRCRTSTRSGRTAIWKSRGAPKNTCCSPTSAPIRRSTSCARHPADRALLRKDRGLWLRRLPAASDLDRAVGMARRRARPDAIRCIWSPASRATGCTARWMQARSAPRGKVAGREAIAINPADAKARGIGDGDVVRVFNARGACLAGAIVTDTMRPGVVDCPAAPGTTRRRADDAPCAHGNANVLTRDRGTSQLGQGPSSATALVEVERWAEPPPVRAFYPPPHLQGA